MASLKLYQMYDHVAMEVIGTIIAANRDEVVIRQFCEVLARPETLPGQYPEDFALMVIGEQNRDTGELTATDPQIVYTGRVWLRLKDLKVASSSAEQEQQAGAQSPSFIETPDMQQHNEHQSELRRRLEQQRNQDQLIPANARTKLVTR